MISRLFANKLASFDYWIKHNLHSINNMQKLIQGIAGEQT